MKRFSGLPLVLALAAVGAAPAPKPTPTPRAKSHARAVEGRVVSVTAHRAFVVKTAAGESAALELTGATHLTGGRLAPGELVSVRYIARDGKKVATSVRVESAHSGSPTAAALASP